MNATIPELLDNILAAIDADQFDAVVQQLQDFLTDHADQLDLRATREIRLIQKLLEYRADLQDWDYFRGLKAVYRYCEETYATDAVCGPAPDPRKELPDKGSIWWCWLQGLDDAPPVAKACLKSLEQLEKKIHVLDRENLREYVTMPEHILRKWKDGIIDNTHFSDLVRLELLTERGGAWIDATAYCTDPAGVNRILDEAPLFCHRVVMQDGSSDYTTYDNWFLSAVVPSAILTDTKRMLYQYWADEDHLKHYYLFHIFFTLATWRHPEECAQIPVYSTEPCHVMQMEMLHPFTQPRWQQLCDMSGIHKLTWKYDTKADLRGTILQHVIEG